VVVEAPLAELVVPEASLPPPPPEPLPVDEVVGAVPSSPHATSTVPRIREDRTKESVVRMTENFTSAQATAADRHARTVAATASGVKPNSFWRTLAGALAPNAS